MRTTSKILLGTDFSEPASKAAEVAADEARRRGAQLHVLHVVRSPAQVAASTAEASRLLAQLGTEVPAISAIGVGNPAAEIVRYAAEHGVDLIVIGSHGRTGGTQALLGSVTERVVRTSTQPVLVVPYDRQRGARPPAPAVNRCVICGAKTEDLVCEACRTNIRMASGAASWLAHGTGYAGALERAQCEQLLGTELVGRLACHAGGRLYVVPIAYAYRDGAVYIRCSQGTKVRMMRENPSVCLQVDHIVDLANWRSVIVWGVFHELLGAEATAGLQTIKERLSAWASNVDGRPAPSFSDLDSAVGHRAVGLGREAVIGRIEITEMAGRYQQR